MTIPEAILVEDEPSVRLATTQTLELCGFTVRACESAEDAQGLLRLDFPGIVVTDVRLPGRSGLELLADVVALDPDLPVIVITGHGDVGMAVQAMRLGAYDFLEKPFSSARLTNTVERAREKRALILENRRLKTAWEEHADTPALIGASPAIEKVRKFIRDIGPAAVDILINGQTGAGKEVVARQLHAASGRTGPFVALNCGALPESMFESEIFGHEAGAFTSARKRRIGKLEFARGGTVFLDEIESMPLNLQVKLLRALQERKLERLGGNESIDIDCCFITASKANLLSLSDQGRFRHDLYYRLGVVNLDLPSLADRRDDIPMLLAYFVSGATLRFRRSPLPWSAEQMHEWQSREWPGNVRELRNFADRLVLGLDSPMVTAAPASRAEEPGDQSLSLPQRMDEFERKLIKEALHACGNNVGLAAAKLDIPKKTLYDKIKRFGMRYTQEKL